MTFGYPVLGAVAGAGTSNVWQTDGTDIWYTAGNVGIGLSSPTYTLHLSATDTEIGLLNSSGSGKLYRLRSLSTGSFDIFHPTAQSIFRVDTTGYVALGETVTPSSSQGIYLFTNTLGATSGVTMQNNHVSGDIVRIRNSSGTKITIPTSGNILSATTGSFLLSNAAGTAAAPTYSFVGDTDTGIFSSSADKLEFAVGGIAKLRLESTHLISPISGTGAIKVDNVGSAANPAFTFNGDYDTGFYSDVANNLKTSIGGTLKQIWNANHLYGNQSGSYALYHGATPSATNPAYAFNGDDNTGIFSDTADVIKFSAGGSTVAKINDTTAMLDVDQSSTTGAKPVLLLDQGDVSEEFIRLIGTSTTDASQSLVDAADMTTPGSIVGWIKVYIQDDQASGPITDGIYYVPFYSAPTA